MTDPLYPVKTINGHDVAASALLRKPPSDVDQRHGDLALAPEEADEITCVCGFRDDDGYSVACDSCNRWQHMVCYYPHYEHLKAPDDLQHYCVDCRPRTDIDISRARDIQRRRTEEAELQTNGVKRQPSKSHKKKVKDVPYTNGWPMDKARHDRNSASPRDQPPPAKRPKTSHRTSDPLSSSNATKGHARRRTATNINHRRSRSHSPEFPTELYSEEFIRSYRDNEWRETDANLHDSIAIAGALSTWLSASEEEFLDRHGQVKGDILNRWDGNVDDIPGKAQLNISEAQDDRMRDENNQPVTWKFITVEEPVASGAYIGELKGHLGFKDQYIKDPANRWSLLRHPEPFVFFHPRLPIYIDARILGTELRYVRRSCQPNVKLQILVTGGTSYHFCFMATEQIDPGMEIAVGWDTSDSIPEFMARGELNHMKPKEMGQLPSWVSTVLANCGPCACQLPESECLMARFDRRGEMGYQEDDAVSLKAPHQKKRKVGQHISPLNTNFNSRSGSEVRKGDFDDERSDSRSASGSVGRGSASRDITPNTHYSHNGSLSTAPELSERERKKLAKEEEIFRRQEEERMGKSTKKKRNSGGSTLNTPNPSSSRQLGFGGSSRYADAGTSKQTGLPAKPGRKPKASNANKTPVKTITRVVKRPKPDYVDSEVQCDMDQVEAERRTQIPRPRKPYVPLLQRLLQRLEPSNGKQAVKLPGLVDDKMDVDSVQATKSPSPRLHPGAEAEAASVTKIEPDLDTEMKDVDAARSTGIASTVGTAENMLPSSSSPTISNTTPDQPSAPPWPSQAAHSAADAPLNASDPSKPSDMHITMPPPPTNPFAQPPSISSTGTPSLPATLTISPASLTAPSLFSPSVTAAVTPSPVKTKKMSLSDYTKRTKAKDKDDSQKGDRDSSPAAAATMPLEGKAGEGSAIVDEAGAAGDVKMEDVDAAVKG